MKSLLGSAVFSTLAAAASLISGFASSVIVARLLGPEGAGVVAFAIWLTMTGSMVVNFGSSAVLLRYSKRFDEDGCPGGGLARTAAWRFTPPLILFCAGLLAYGLLPQEAPDAYPASFWAVTAALAAAFTLAAQAMAAARGLDRFKETTKLAFWGCLLQLPLVALGAWTFGAAGALLGYVARHVPQALRFWHYARGRKGQRPPVMTEKMKTHARNSWISEVIGALVWGRIEILFLSLFFTATVTGYYAVGLSLAALVVQLPSQMVAGLTPHIGFHRDRGNMDQIRATYSRVFRWMSMLILPICLGGFAVMPALLPLLFGTQFQPAVGPAGIVLLASILTALSVIPSHIINAFERTDMYLLASPVTAAVSIALLLVLVPFHETEGAAVARLLVHFMWFAWLLAFCWTALKIAPPLASLARILAAGLCCALAAALTLHQIDQTWTGLTGAIAAGGAVYLAALRLFGCIERAEIDGIAANVSGVLPQRIARPGIALLRLLAR
ncbi:hypothetical protein GCM10011316_20750 [Roseibium aquae]|uniref:O-antigen/teichoic acid export membrane protein n=1 Tax=Roseibium aquae TaxID=1323746 RepID=A0A916TJL1_9HYPH|nr:lipopolysaccharide biosynthesis protein [Roseibium aquae]GGB48471.1 hypothetical protein GCM10011316_20750 [Roseibium aquae]